MKHGIESYRDGPYAFTSPALVNTIYGRWWHPLDEKAGPNPVPNSPLPWTGDYEDGLGNRITMLAYANPEDRSDERKRADGFGIARFKKSTRKVTFECYKRFSDKETAKGEQFPGWPITFHISENDGRKVFARLPEVGSDDYVNPVIQVIEKKSGEILYTTRARGESFGAPVYGPGTYDVKIGRDKPNTVVLKDYKVPAK